MLISSYVSIISPLGIGPSLPSVAHVSVHKQSGPLSTSSAGSLSRPQPSQGSAGGGPIPNLTRVAVGRPQTRDGCSQQHQSLAPWPFQRAAYSMAADFPQNKHSKNLTGSCKSSYNLALEVPDLHCHHILLVKQVLRPVQI